MATQRILFLVQTKSGHVKQALKQQRRPLSNSTQGDSRRYPVYTISTRFLSNTASFPFIHAPHPFTSSQFVLVKRFKCSPSFSPYNDITEDGYITTRNGTRKKVDKLDPSFTNNEASFKSKSTWEVVRGYLIFRLCSIGPIVENNEKLMQLGKSVLGERLFSLLMRKTFYAQFVAGEDQHRIKPSIRQMENFGVKAILDYSVEEDLSSDQAKTRELTTTKHVKAESNRSAASDAENIEETGRLKNKGTHTDKIKRYHAHSGDTTDRRYKVTSARTYFYKDEALCERNMEIFLKCIEAVADSTHKTGFTAIKMTALGRPSLLLQLSEVIVRARRFYQSVSGKEGFVIEGKVSKEAFEKRFKQLIHNDEHADAEQDDVNLEVKDWLTNLTSDKKGLIHLFSWSGLIDSKLLMKDVFQVPNLKTGRMESMINALTDEEEQQFANMLRRIRTVFEAAKQLDVRVMVDAEQTYFQPAIHRLTMEMMKKFNTEKALVFNTYQCYLKIAYHSLILDLEQANRQNFYFGAKLVRGAYMEQERERARLLGYEDPVNVSYEATGDMYHACLNECMERMIDLRNKNDNALQDSKKIGIMVATHNADTIRYTIERMKELDIRPEDMLICFGQLYGMCDNISFPLGQAGYSVYKYVPYGPVNEVLPYLSRRARENRGMLSKLSVETSLHQKELGRRLMKGQIFHRPEGGYVPVGFENRK